MSEMRWLIKENGLSANILMFFMEHMDTRNAIACSYELLMDYFECSRSTVYRALNVLEKNGFVGVLKSGTSNVYIVNHELAWSSWSNGKKYARLDGVILVSHKENKDYDDNLRKQRYNTFKASIRDKESRFQVEAV